MTPERLAEIRQHSAEGRPRHGMVGELLEALAVLGRQLAEKDEALRAIIAKSEQSAHLPAHDRNLIESIARSGLSV